MNISRWRLCSTLLCGFVLLAPAASGAVPIEPEQKAAAAETSKPQKKSDEYLVLIVRNGEVLHAGVAEGKRIHRCRCKYRNDLNVDGLNINSRKLEYKDKITGKPVKFTKNNSAKFLGKSTIQKQHKEVWPYNDGTMIIIFSSNKAAFTVADLPAIGSPWNEEEPRKPAQHRNSKGAALEK